MQGFLTVKSKIMWQPKANICVFWNSPSQDSGCPTAQDGSMEDPGDFCDIV